MKIKSNIAISETGFVFDPNTGDSFSLNPIGLEIFKMMKEGKRQDDIQKTLSADYDVDAATLENNFFEFISMLKYYQLTEQDA